MASLHNAITKNPASKRKIIYVISSNNHKGWLKIGDTSEKTLGADNRPNSSYLKSQVRQRVNSYMNTSGDPYNICWAELAYNDHTGNFFRDYDVHRVLKNSNYRRGLNPNRFYDPRNEWFKLDVNTAKRAITAVKNGKDKISHYVSKHPKRNNIIFRREQKDFINKTTRNFNSKRNNNNVMLWDAKMRFGKTLCALQVAKNIKAHSVLIATHRPVVNSGWLSDFRKLFGNHNDRYRYGSRNSNNTMNLSELKSSGANYFYFVSLQDLDGSTKAGGKFSKDFNIFNTKWDLLIIDEAHEGTQTNRGKNVDNALQYKRKLLLSGTPFNIINKFIKKFGSKQICRWDYIDEQKAKHNWAKNHNGSNESNPYTVLPKMKIFTFRMNSKFNYFYKPYSRSFNFSEFLRVNKKTGRFVHEKYVKQFLNNITTPNSKTNYPYSTKEYRNYIHHSLWKLPSIAAANAMEKLLNQNKIFKHFKIINIVKNNDDYSYSTDDVKTVEHAIHNFNYTITLTVRKMTLGVTIPQWTAVVFLSDTSSAALYLQTAFRAQSPYYNLNFKKTCCYVFDFSPERTLSLIAKAVDYNPKNHGDIMESQKRNQLAKLIKFLPIVGEHGNKMKPYRVDKLFQSLKRRYANRAVNDGFDSKYLYKDNLLLHLNNIDITHFKQLGNIVSPTKASSRKLNKLIINNNDLTRNEVQSVQNNISKPKKDRTPEQQAEINKYRKANSKRRGLIALLRSISIRIPLMIYGMDIKFDQNITLNDFINNVDDESWEEFMPNNVTKQVFRDFTKFYDSDVFIEAGKIIRRKVKIADRLDPMDRTHQIADIMLHFKNPDKETVLTPWNIVNLHLANMFGGLDYYKHPYQIQNEYIHWVANSNLKVFNPYAKILEINSKTGLYPLYMTNSLYYQEFNQMNTYGAGKFNYSDEIEIWDNILKHNIFIIAKTKMAKQIAIRTLIGYRNVKLNIHYEKDLVKKAKKFPENESNHIKEELNSMKFDVVIGNPPYQKSDKGSSVGASPIYQYFVNLSEKLSNKYVSLIIPARWYAGGKGLDKFRAKMLNDKHIKELYDFETPTDVFPHTEIKGGLTIFLWDKDFNNTKTGVKFVRILNNKIVDSTDRPLKTGNLNILIRDSHAVNILNRISYDKGSMEKAVSTRKPFHLPSKFWSSKHFKHQNNGNSFYCYANYHKSLIHGYVNKNKFLNELNPKGKYLSSINKWKIFTPHINALGTDAPDDHFQTIIGKPNTICTETYMMIGYNLHLDKESSIHLAKYLKTKFSRYLLSVAKTSHNAPRKVYYFIPMQDFSNHSDIDWGKPLSNIDKQLFDKYKLNDKQRNFINKSIKDQA